MDYNKEIIKLRYLVEAEFELTPEELDGRSKKGDLGTARIIFGNLLMYELKLKPAQVPKYVNRDRSLFYYYAKLHDGYMSDARIFPDYFKRYNKIKSRYYNLSDAIMQEKTEERKHKMLYDVECNIEKLEKKRQMLIETL